MGKISPSLCPSLSALTREGSVREDTTVLGETLLQKLAVLWKSWAPVVRRGQILQLVFSIRTVTSKHAKCERTLLDVWCNIAWRQGVWHLVAALLFKRMVAFFFMLCFSPFHVGLCRSACKKNATASLGSFQKCMLFSCTQERAGCLAVNTGTSLSEVWFLPLCSSCWSRFFMASRPSVLVPSPAPAPGAPCHDIVFMAAFSARRWNLQVW